MKSTAIRIEHLYKQYKLGMVSTGTVSHDLNRWWHRMRGKEDPYEKVTVSNNREAKGSGDYVWALEDINFEVKQGEVLGIIGKNGAGKSTLLKILSKVTSPTKGQIKVNGRIASLLEVGTGFHPELSGRENIFLNGAILGMTKKEIRGKFDEIVDFSGVEKYIDTPVKRYSSGMYVRLAFAVAAHLEPEILIIDEVLAVGDAEFQKKCLGKMKDVSDLDGRTVLFVSHNMAAIQNLCTRGLFLEQGKLKINGTAQEAINYYLNSNVSAAMNELSNRTDRKGNGYIRYQRVYYADASKQSTGSIQCGSKGYIVLEYEATRNDLSQVVFGIGVNDHHGIRITNLSNDISNQVLSHSANGLNKVYIEIPRVPFRAGRYTLALIATANNEIADWIQDAAIMTVEPGDFYNSGKTPGEGQGQFFLPFSYSYEQ